MLAEHIIFHDFCAFQPTLYTIVQSTKHVQYTVKNGKNILRPTSSTPEIDLWSRWEAKSHIETRKFPHLEEI